MSTSRRQMLISKPGSQQNWITFAMASFMAKDYETTFNSVGSMLKFEEEKVTFKPNENNGLRLLQVRCQMCMGDMEKALEMLEANKDHILDQIKFYELQGQLRLNLNNHEEALDSFEHLLELNAANFETYYKLIECHKVDLPKDRTTFARHNLSEEDSVKVNEVLHKYQQSFPRVNAPSRIALKLLKGDLFKAALKKFVRPLLIKGAPSVMTDLKELYHDSEKVAGIQE